MLKLMNRMNTGTYRSIQHVAAVLIHMVLSSVFRVMLSLG